MSLSLDAVVSVSISVSPKAPTARGFGVAAIFGTSAVLPLHDRIREYADIDEVDVDFATTDEEYKAAQTWFSQEPAPETVKIARIFTSAQAARLRGGTASTTLTDYTAITDGGFDININGVNRTIADLNFSGAANIAAVAALVQTALNTALAGTTCVYTDGAFLITSPTTGVASTIGYAVTPTTGGPSVDITGLLELKAADGALAVQGIAAESITDGLNATKLVDPDFYGLTLTAFATEQNIKDAAAWTQTQVCLFAYTTSDANAKSAVATSDLGYFFKNLGYSRTMGQYSTTNPYAAVSLLARELIVDFDQPNSTITLKFKQEPGVAAEALTTTEASALQTKNLNYYVDRGGFLMIEEGVVANGRFVDEVHGLDWLQNALQVAIFGKLATQPTKIPLTDAGAAILVLEAKKVFRKAVNNGLIAPGVWHGQNLGEVKSEEFLDTGYYVYASPVADQLAADRDLRKSPPISAICIGAGAIHSVALSVTFQR
jgi:hypothetical protein